MLNAVIIGSGISGLCISALLKKKGLNPIIFEKNNQIGGSFTSISYRGYTLDTGLHLITRGKSGEFPKLLREIFTKEVFSKYFTKQDDYIFHLNDKSSKFPKNLREFFNFKILSPKSRFDLFRLIISILKIGRKNTDKNLKNISSYEFTKKYLKNKDLFFLCNALSWMSTGCSIKEGSLCRFADTIARDKTFSLSYLLNSIKKKSDALEGDFYPIGGLKKIPKLFESLNFEIHKNEEIKKILIRNNKVSGIKTNKTQYKADIVIYTGKVLELKKIASEYKGKFPKNEEYKAITLWLGLNKKIAYFGKNSHIIIKNDESSPLWFMDLTSFDSNLSPKGKQLIGISTILHKDKNLILKDMKQTAGKLMPDYKKYLEMEKVMIDRAEKTLQTYNNPLWDLPEQRTNIKGLYLAGTDTKAFGSGGTMCAGSAYSCINFIEKDFKLLKSN